MARLDDHRLRAWIALQRAARSMAAWDHEIVTTRLPANMRIDLRNLAVALEAVSKKSDTSVIRGNEGRAEDVEK